MKKRMTPEILMDYAHMNYPKTAKDFDYYIVRFLMILCAGGACWVWRDQCLPLVICITAINIVALLSGLQSFFAGFVRGPRMYFSNGLVHLSYACSALAGMAYLLGLLGCTIEIALCVSLALGLLSIGVIIPILFFRIRNGTYKIRDHLFAMQMSCIIICLFPLMFTHAHDRGPGAGRVSPTWFLFCAAISFNYWMVANFTKYRIIEKYSTGVDAIPKTSSECLHKPHLRQRFRQVDTCRKCGKPIQFTVNARSFLLILLLLPVLIGYMSILDEYMNATALWAQKICNGNKSLEHPVALIIILLLYMAFGFLINAFSSLYLFRYEEIEAEPDDQLPKLDAS